MRSEVKKRMQAALQKTAGESISIEKDMSSLEEGTQQQLARNSNFFLMIPDEYEYTEISEIFDPHDLLRSAGASERGIFISLNKALTFQGQQLNYLQFNHDHISDMMEEYPEDEGIFFDISNALSFVWGGPIKVDEIGGPGWAQKKLDDFVTTDPRALASIIALSSYESDTEAVVDSKLYVWFTPNPSRISIGIRIQGKNNQVTWDQLTEEEQRIEEGRVRTTYKQHIKPKHYDISKRYEKESIESYYRGPKEGVKFINEHLGPKPEAMKYIQIELDSSALDPVNKPTSSRPSPGVSMLGIEDILGPWPH